MTKVSIILPVYNAEKTINDSIKSIVEQTFKDWELIVINDGSTDNTENVILSFKDYRINYIKNDCNKGLIYTLNRGLNISKGEYIARMDADDISLSSRIEKQVIFMDSHPDIIVCGTQIEYFGTKQTSYFKLKFPTRDKELKEMLAFATCFAHPTVVIRKNVLTSNKVQYNPVFKNAEDYNMWIDLMPFGKFANLSETLLKYRISDTQISQPSNVLTEKSVLLCKRKYLKQYLSEQEISKLFNTPISISTIKRIKRVIKNPKVIEACYLSLDNYGIGSVIYYIRSLDIFKLGFGAFIRYAKRFIYGKNPIYYNK